MITITIEELENEQIKLNIQNILSCTEGERDILNDILVGLEYDYDVRDAIIKQLEKQSEND